MCLFVSTPVCVCVFVFVCVCVCSWVKFRFHLLCAFLICGGQGKAHANLAHNVLFGHPGHRSSQVPGQKGFMLLGFFFVSACSAGDADLLICSRWLHNASIEDEDGAASSLVRKALRSCGGRSCLSEIAKRVASHKWRSLMDSLPIRESSSF